VTQSFLVHVKPAKLPCRRHSCK